MKLNNQEALETIIEEKINNIPEIYNIVNFFQKIGNDKIVEKRKIDLKNLEEGYANTVAAESSGNKTESFAIASAISNISDYKDKDILKTIQTEGIYGYKDGGNSTNYKNNSKYGMAAAINALTGGTDYSGGALRWDGFDLAAKGFNHIKARTAGIEISDKNFNAFKAAWPN